MRILYVTTIGGTMDFFKTLIKELIENGHIVDIATNESISKVSNFYRELGCKIYQISTSRSPFSVGNFKAIKQIRNIAKDYDIVHCHTPLAGMASRLACRKLRKKQGIKVIYTAHGFHFYKGAPLKNWLLYYPIEKLCSRWTDVLITINKEDYELAHKKMKAKRVEYVPGVGINVTKFANTSVDRVAKRRELGIPEDAFVLISVGELNKNKNHQIVIRAIAELKISNVHYMIAGEGILHDDLIQLTKRLGLEQQVHFLGYRNDVMELYHTADVNVFPSIREGLGLAAIEGMASGLPLICSDNRGTREYALQNENAIVCISDSVIDFCNAIIRLSMCRDDLVNFGINGQSISKQFDVIVVNGKIQSIYGGLDIVDRE